MTIVPEYLKGIPAYEFCALGFQRLDTEHGQKIPWLLMCPASLTARSTWAAVAKVAVGVSAGVAIRPGDGQRVVPGLQFDFSRQLGHRKNDRCPWSVVRGQWSVVRCPLSVVSGPWSVACAPVRAVCHACSPILHSRRQVSSKSTRRVIAFMSTATHRRPKMNCRAGKEPRPIDNGQGTTDHGPLTTDYSILIPCC